MSKAKLDGEFRVRDYFIANGLRVERFAKAEMRQGRTPDFRVYAGDELARLQPIGHDHRLGGVGGGDHDIGIAYGLLGRVHGDGAQFVGEGAPLVFGPAPDFHRANGPHRAHGGHLGSGLKAKCH